MTPWPATGQRVTVPKDGNCFFHCAVMLRLSGSDVDHMAIRKAVADYMVCSVNAFVACFPRVFVFTVFVDNP